MKAPDPRQLLVLFVPWEWGWSCCAGGSEGTDPSPRDRDSVPEPGPARGTQGAHFGTNGLSPGDCLQSFLISLPPRGTTGAQSSSRGSKGHVRLSGQDGNIP